MPRRLVAVLAASVFAAIVGMTAGLIVTGTTTASAATLTYDDHSIARSEVSAFPYLDASTVQSSAASEASASPSVTARATSTAHSVVLIATNSAHDVMAGVRAAGSEGEAAAGIVKNTQRIPSLSDSAAYRIPDELGNGVLGEVKNVSNLSYSSQLRDFAAYAQQQGLTFNLYVRGSTTLSGPLQAAVDNGSINLIRSLPG